MTAFAVCTLFFSLLAVASLMGWTVDSRHVEYGLRSPA
jgi:hypothetical protein